MPPAVPPALSRAGERSPRMRTRRPRRQGQGRRGHASRAISIHSIQDSTSPDGPTGRPGPGPATGWCGTAGPGAAPGRRGRGGRAGVAGRLPGQGHPARGPVPGAAAAALEPPAGRTGGRRGRPRQFPGFAAGEGTGPAPLKDKRAGLPRKNPAMNPAPASRPCSVKSGGSGGSSGPTGSLAPPTAVRRCHRTAPSAQAHPSMPRHQRRYGMGLTGWPLTQTPKWRWVPVDAPVVPISPMTCPRRTTWPGST